MLLGEVRRASSVSSRAASGYAVLHVLLDEGSHRAAGLAARVTSETAHPHAARGDQAAADFVAVHAGQVPVKHNDVVRC